jgi:D-alanyl-D-alanine carboxypeptidase
MAYYQTSETEPHPIDIAAARFLVTALCGDQAATLSTPALRRLVDRRQF